MLETVSCNSWSECDADFMKFVLNYLLKIPLIDNSKIYQLFFAEIMRTIKLAYPLKVTELFVTYRNLLVSYTTYNQVL